MPLLTPCEALNVSDSFLKSLYGREIFHSWKQMKIEMQFVTERAYVKWLLDVARLWREMDKVEPSVEALGSSTAILKSEDVYKDYMRIMRCAENDNEHMACGDVGNVSAVDDDVNAEAVLECDQSMREEKSVYYGIVSNERRVGDERDLLDVADASDILHSQLLSDGVEEVAAEGTVAQEYQPDQEGAGTVIDEPQAVATPILYSVDPENKRKLYHCPQCIYSSSKRGHIARHLKAVHERFKPFICPHCSYRCSQKTNLKQHLIYKHGHSSKYSCPGPGCDKRFSRGSELRKHTTKCPLLRDHSKDIVENNTSTQADPPAIVATHQHEKEELEIGNVEEERNSGSLKELFLQKKEEILFQDQ